MSLTLKIKMTWGAFFMANSTKKRLTLSKKKQVITLNILHNEHLTSCKARRLSQHTIDTYESNYRLLSEFLTEEYDISQLSNKGVHDYINFLCDNYSSKTTTLNSRLRYVRNLFNFAHEQGYCDKLKIKLIKENVENKTPLTKDEVQKLIARPKSVRFTEVKMWVIANLVLSTGIRSRNVREVRVSDLDLQNRTLYLRDTKSHKSQTVYLSKSVVKVLNEWLRLTELPSDSPLFPNEFGEEMSLDVCKMAFIRYAQRRGVNTSLHILRHTYARDLVQADVNPVIIKELLGHHSLEVTQRYIKLFSDDIRKATDGLDTLAQYQKNRIKLGGNK